MSNPLKNHFRQPQLYLELPSQGKWYEPGSLEMPESGEVPIYSMTAKDEIMFKTPDALLNGEATRTIIESCVPSIKNAWGMPSIDLDAVLIAIRQATYGNEMEFTSVCPHCDTASDYNIDLSIILSNLPKIDYKIPLEINGLIFKFKPISFKIFNTVNLENFRQEQALAHLQDESLTEEERKIKFSKMFNDVVVDAINRIVDCVYSITTSDGTVVTDKSQITEFFNNCDKFVWEKVKEVITTINESIRLKPLNLICNNEMCKKEFESTMNFEQSNFFE